MDQSQTYDAEGGSKVFVYFQNMASHGLRWLTLGHSHLKRQITLASIKIIPPTLNERLPAVSTWFNFYLYYTFRLNYTPMLLIV